MKGTAILFQDQEITFFEDVDHTVYEEIKNQCGCSQMLDDKVVDLSLVSPVFWHEDEVDWDYGY